MNRFIKVINKRGHLIISRKFLGILISGKILCVQKSLTKRYVVVFWVTRTCRHF